MKARIFQSNAESGRTVSYHRSENTNTRSPNVRETRRISIISVTVTATATATVAAAKRSLAVTKKATAASTQPASHKKWPAPAAQSAATPAFALRGK